MKKNYNLELIRMISFLMVIVIHITNYFCRSYGEIPADQYVFSLILDTVSRVSVPCFFMITGALLLGREESLHKHGARLFRFITVLLVWSVIYWLWNTFYMKTEVELSQILYTPAEPHLWYLYAMIPIYCVMPFFQVMCRHMGKNLERAFLILITAAVIFNYVVSLQKEEAYYDLPLIGDRIYSYYIFIGYYITKYKDRIHLSRISAAWISGLSLSAIFLLTLGITEQSGDHYEKLLEYGNPLLALASAAFFFCMLRIRDGQFQPSDRARSVISLVCECSFGIYLIHILFLDHYKKFMEPADLSAWIAVPVLTISIAALSLVCIRILRRTFPGRMIT